MKKKSLVKKLFFAYFWWIIGCFAMISLSFVVYISQIIEEDIINTQNQLCDSLEENIENYFEDMNDFSMQLLTSNEFKNTAIVALPNAYENNTNQTPEFANLYEDAYGMIENKYKIGVVVDEKYYIWMGNNYQMGGIEEVDTYSGLTRNETAIIQYLSHNQYLNQINSNYEEQEFVTLSRSMDNRNKYVDGRAILEVMVEKEEFEQAMRGMMGDAETHDLKLHIYDSYGNPIYTETDLDLSAYMEQGEEATYENGSERILVNKIYDDKLSVVFTLDLNAYYSTLYLFLITTSILLLLLLVIMTIITYRTSKAISRPIFNICEQVKQMNLNESMICAKQESEIEEVDFLSESIQSMGVQLNQSLEEIIALKDYEIQAKMLALQAQMQPHFLYNTLTTINTMAESEGNYGISRICTSLTQMFRYITVDAPSGVHVYEEIQHLQNYVAIMQERFPECLVQIDLPLEMYEIKIPKLTIQPLVENAFKYDKKAQKIISVRGDIKKNGSWEITVEDNGDGFTREKVHEIYMRCEEAMEGDKTLLGKIDGMGLVNVYVRLKLLLGDSIRYDIEDGLGRISIRYRGQGNDNAKDESVSS